MAKLPGFMFYPGDWLKDPNLRRCSHAAKGVWIEILCLMFECEERGVLATDGVAWTDSEIVRAVGGDEHVALSCLRELVDKVVAGRNSSGAIYCRRMVRDEEQRQNNALRTRRWRSKSPRDAPVGDASVTQMCTRMCEYEDEDPPQGKGLWGKGGKGKPSRGLPRNVDDAIKLADMQGVPKDFAIEIYHQASAINWVDGLGRSITNFRNYIHGRWIKRQSEIQEKNARNNHKPITGKPEQTLIDKMIDEI